MSENGPTNYDATISTPLTLEKKAPNLGDLINAMDENRDARRDLEAQVKALKTQYAALESQLIAFMRDQNIASSRGNSAIATIDETVVGTIADKNALIKYIKDEDAFHVVSLHISNPAFRELLESGFVIPGTKPFTKHSISLRKI